MLTDLINHINATRHLNVRVDDLTIAHPVSVLPGQPGDYAVAQAATSDIWHMARFDGATWHGVGFEVGPDWVWAGLREPARESAAFDLESWAYAALADMREKALRGILMLRQDKDEAQNQADGAGDEADISAAREAHETRMRALATLQDRLSEIDAAIDRLRSGDYGVCEITGEDIPVARLRANPVARTTVEAQERRERAGRLVLRATA